MKRTELYRLVWTEPITRLARSYGLSDVGFTKLCKRHEIPTPPRGFWAQRQHGQTPEQIPLPNPDLDPEIRLNESTDASASNEARPRIEKPMIAVAESLRGCHELVSRANQEIQDAATDSDGIITCEQAFTLNVKTTKTNTHRALLIFDALLKECIRQGYEVTAGPTIKILNYSMKLCIYEEINVTRVESEADLSGKYIFNHSRFEVNRTPSNRLTVAITGDRLFWASGTRATWRDTDKSRLENHLGKVIVALDGLAHDTQTHEEEEARNRELAKKEEARRVEAARSLADRKKEFKAEKARVATLVDQAESFRESKAIREFIEAIRLKHSKDRAIAPDSDVGRWIEWATRQADRLDPLVESPSSILDEDLEDPEPLIHREFQSNNRETTKRNFWASRNWWSRNR